PPPLQGEGRIAEGDPGWGPRGGEENDRVAGGGCDAAYAKALSPPPGPLHKAGCAGFVQRAGLPLPGGGEEARQSSFLVGSVFQLARSVLCLALSLFLRGSILLPLPVRRDGGIEIGALGQRVGQDRVLQVGAFEARAAQIGAVQIGAV